MLITGLHTVGCSGTDAVCGRTPRQAYPLTAPVDRSFLPAAVPVQVADIFCNVCNTNLGWKYEMAFEEGQKYKVRVAAGEQRMRNCRLTRPDAPHCADEHAADTC